MLAKLVMLGIGWLRSGPSRASAAKENSIAVTLNFGLAASLQKSQRLSTAGWAAGTVSMKAVPDFRQRAI